MQQFTRIVCDPAVMDGRPCIRGIKGTQIAVSTVLTLMAQGRKTTEIMAAYPQLEPADLTEILAYAAWHVDRIIETPVRAM